MEKNVLKMKYKIISVLLSIVILMTGFSHISYGESIHKNYSEEEILEIIEGIINWKKSSTGVTKEGSLLNNKFLEDAGDTIGDWYPIGIGRIGYIDDYEAYLAVIEDKVSQRYLEEDKLSGNKSTEWHRISLAILSMGGDPTNIGKDAKGKPINLIADGTYNREKSLGAQGINGWTWGLIALDSMRYITPEDASYTRDDIITEIMKLQLADGGFSLQDEEADPDITAMVLQAFAPYYNSEQKYTYTQKKTNKKVTKTVRQVVDEALETLSSLQLDDGDFESWGAENSESTAQVLVALCALGKDPINDARFIKNGNTLLDGLMKYRMEDGGFIHSKVYDSENPTSKPDESNSMASEQALYSLVALSRYKGGYRSLYDFRPEMDENIKSQINSVQESIDSIPASVSSKDASKVKHIFSEYLKIPISERSYVYNYYKLSDAMESLKIDNTSEPIAANIGVNEKGNGAITPIFDGSEALSSGVLFTEEDVNKVKNLPEKLTTEHYVEVVKLIKKLERAKNKDEYINLLDDLNVKKKEIEKIKEEIELLNNEILDKLYPFDKLSIKDKKNVDEIVSRFNKLSNYDQKKVLRYEDVIKSKTQVDNLIRARIITIVIVIIICIGMFFIVRRMKKRKREKMKQKMLLIDDEEFEEFSDEEE
ncbi:terpene cyclase/mutase family protein [Anaerosalibacter bizertensis]|uniref:Terpene cyclase/mutase family protein n=1 Tax=Anaerosalibacter bizertensis TaxID=932217 RepID=A0A844FF54_9FIRM|nr:prenyltransferase/squalene oxidase repeat-containing protein [Anaerosalibacter bizertensis]MSS42556.1 terpene cyclase/mutase family protein [Anaerosalibacter bizertensis]